MPRNGSGTYSLPATMAPANTVSNSTTVNSVMSDVATALTDSINVDGTKAFEANQPMGGFKFTGAGNGSARTDSVALGQVQDGLLNWVDGGGTADAITATYSPAITSLTDGQVCYVRATAANATTTPTFSPNGLTARTIVKHGNAALAAGDISADGHELILRYRSSDTKWELLNPKAAAATSATTSAEGVVELATTTELLTGTDTTRAATVDSIAALWEQGSDVASSGTISLGEGGYFNITGTTTITDIDFATDKAGRKAWVKFAGALTLTHNATTLILPGGANITTAAGDTACFVSEGSDAVRCVSYNKASGAAVVSSGGITSLGTITTTSGTSQSLSSLTLTGYKYLRLVYNGVDISANDSVLVGNSTADDVSMTVALGTASPQIYGVVDIELSSGYFTSISVTNTGAPTSGVTATSQVGVGAITTATTTITVSANSGSFTAGSIRVYGIA